MQPIPMNESRDDEDIVIDLVNDEESGASINNENELIVSAQADLLRKIADLIAQNLRKSRP